MNKYASYTEKGKIHLGETIKKYMDENHIRYSSIAKEIGITRGGLTNLLKKESLDSMRIQQLSKALKHDFFKYLLQPETQEEILRASESEAEYKKKPKPKRRKITLIIDDDESEDSPLMKRLSEFIEKLNEESE